MVYELDSISGTPSLGKTKILSDLNYISFYFPQVRKYFPVHVNIFGSTVMREFILYFEFYFYKGEKIWILLSCLFVMKVIPIARTT